MEWLHKLKSSIRPFGTPYLLSKEQKKFDWLAKHIITFTESPYIEKGLL